MNSIFEVRRNETIDVSSPGPGLEGNCYRHFAAETSCDEFSQRALNQWCGPDVGIVPTKSVLIPAEGSPWRKKDKWSPRVKLKDGAIGTIVVDMEGNPKGIYFEHGNCLGRADNSAKDPWLAGLDGKLIVPSATRALMDVVESDWGKQMLSEIFKRN